MKYSLLLAAWLCCILSATEASAQGQNKNWCFGHGRGVTFNTPTPSFFEQQMRATEGSAAVSDAGGNLLFYSSGGNNWDRDGNLMPNGSGLSGNGPGAPWGNVGSSTYGVVIVPSPSNINQYYVVTTDAIETAAGNAYYSLVDMTLNGGMGDVVLSERNVLLSTNVFEGVTATRATGCSGFWVVMHSKNGSEYRAFKIDNNGMSTTPVLSYGQVGNGSMGANYGRLRFNNSGNKIVRGFSYDFEIGNFDQATGIFSSFFLTQVPLTNGCGFFSFSPDDTKLYSSGVSGITQFDLNLLPDTNAFQNNQLSITHKQMYDLRLGPDNKLYILRNTDPPVDTIDVINYPNLAGAACQYQPGVIAIPPYLPDPSAFFAELGNPVLSLTDEYVPPTMTEIQTCFASQHTLNAPNGYLYYAWNTGAMTQQLQVTQDGLYWVSGLKDCKMHVDSFRVQLTNFDIDLGTDTGICAGQQVALDVTTPGATYLWNDNNQAATRNVGPGNYRVEVRVGDCSRTDSIKIGAINPSLQIADKDSTRCKGEVLYVEASPESDFIWSTGSTANSAVINNSGMYTVTASNICGSFSDSVYVEATDCRCFAFVPNAFSPNNDGKNERLEVQLYCLGASEFTMVIYNRYGQRIFESKDPAVTWDGTHNGHQADIGAYFYYLQYKDGRGERVKKKGEVLLLR